MAAARTTGPRSASRSTLGSGNSESSSSAAGRTLARAPTSSASTQLPSSLFRKEREKLVTEIADGMEQLLGNVNILNRKLEESISVGQEFGPIADLWGPFVEMLTSHGLKADEGAGGATDGAQRSEEAQPHTQPGSGRGAGASPVARHPEAGSGANFLSSSIDGDGAIANRLPPGVAPGGGTVYGMSSQQ